MNKALKTTLTTLLLLLAQGQQIAAFQLPNETSIEALTKLADAGDIEAMNEVFVAIFGKTTVTQEEKDKALTYLYRSARAGDSIAQYNVGYLHLTGGWLDRDLDKAIEWLRLSAEAGYPKAISLLGFKLYERARTEAPDYENNPLHDEALMYLSMAAENGNPSAMAFMGMYLVRTTNEFDEGLKLLQKAANTGDESAAEALVAIEEDMQNQDRQ